MILRLYDVHDDKKKLIKNLDDFVDEYHVRLKENTSILNPTFILDKLPFEILTLNYAYCPAMKRYYFVNNIIADVGRVVELECEVDVLMTYHKYFDSKKCYIDRQEKNFGGSTNGVFYDPSYPVRAERNISTYNVGKVTTTNGFYLTVNGGVQ